MSTDLRLGRYQDVLGGVEVDAVITDPPYSDRTHAGHDGATRNDGLGEKRLGRTVTRGLGYAPWDIVDALAFVEFWHPRTRGWIVIATDHVLARVFEEALNIAGRYVFPPIPVVEIGSRVRLLGDGPSSWTHWLVVARPKTREFANWGTLRGAYVYTGRGDRAHMGGKRTDNLRDLVRDYSRPGDLVCDPCAGAGTTLLAARLEGRRAVGAESDPETCAKAKARLQGVDTAQPGLFDALRIEVSDGDG